jgi:hypothetical protein
MRFHMKSNMSISEKSEVHINKNNVHILKGVTYNELILL